MSLRCSLLGHEYGESEIERDREERGDEVVISVTELERCIRCGNARVISENTEVTQRSLRDGSREAAGAGPPTSAPRAEANPGSSPERDFEPASEPERESEPESDSRPKPHGSLADARVFRSDSGDSSVETDSSAALDADPGSDDAEIIEGEATEDAEREPGAWPEYDEPDHDGSSARNTAWPSVEGEDEGFDATVPDGEPTDVEFGGGLTPHSTDQGAEVLEDSPSPSPDRSGADADAEFVRARSTIAPDKSVDFGGETEIYCPNCEAADLDERDSLRPGDICPVCHRGYLAERER